MLILEFLIWIPDRRKLTIMDFDLKYVLFLFFACVCCFVVVVVFLLTLEFVIWIPDRRFS